MLLSGGLVGAALGNFIPDPGDIVYFLGQRYLTRQYRAGKLSEGKLWIGEGLVYYVPSALWWGTLALAAWKIKGIDKKLTIVGGVVAAGAIVSLVVRWVTKK